MGVIVNRVCTKCGDPLGGKEEINLGSNHCYYCKFCQYDIIQLRDSATDVSIFRIPIPTWREMESVRNAARESER